MSLMAAMRVSVNQACNLKMVHSIIYKAYYHLLQGPVMLTHNTRSVAIPPTNTLLIPNLPTVVQSCGFKVKGVLKRRCKDCYFVMRQERLYIICKTHPRHKQMSMKAQEKKSWILSHVSQGPVRAW